MCMYVFVCLYVGEMVRETGERKNKKRDSYILRLKDKDRGRM